MRRLMICVAVWLTTAATGWTGNPHLGGKAFIANQPLNDGSASSSIGFDKAMAGLLRSADDLDIVGDTVTIGSTWYELQHNGTIGRMVVLDDSGNLHFVWTNGLDPTSSSRHIYYNAIDPSGLQVYPGTGTQVDNSIKAGFTCLAVDEISIPFPAFHHLIVPSLNYHSAVAAGSYGTFELNWFLGQDLPLIWPRICRKMDGEFLIISTQAMPSNSDPMLQTWCTGSFENLAMNFAPQTALEYTMTIAAEVAASRTSNRVAGAWTACRDEGFPAGNPSQYNNDIHMMIDDDGLNLNFDSWFNLTNFIYPELSLLPDTILANGDTLRAYTDISLLFDQNDFCHAAFTTIGFYQLDSLQTISASLIWHWSEEQPNEFSLIANGWINGVQPGMWNRYVQRPSLGQDPVTGYLYCSYQRFDENTISGGGYPSGEVNVSVSTDGGWNWSVGTNVTNTVSAGGAPAGQCYSELCPSLAEVVDGDCHIMYILDRDAGNSQQANQPEGVATLNPVIYHRVPRDSIAILPLMPQFPEPGSVPFHVQHLPDTTAYRGDPAPAPLQFALEQNAPNPFNPMTQIRFTIDHAAEISLAIYDLQGRLVERIAAGVHSAGQHTYAWNATGRSSGIYICRLEDGLRASQRKMVLIR